MFSLGDIIISLSEDMGKPSSIKADREEILTPKENKSFPIGPWASMSGGCAKNIAIFCLC